MLTLSVPGKVVLFGEWSVAYGGIGIASALDCKFGLKVESQPASDVEFASGAESIRWDGGPAAPEGFFRLAARAIQELGATEVWREKKLTFEPGWQLREGLGSSSAVVLDLLLAQCLLSGETHVATQDLWRRGRDILRAIQSPRASGLDLAAQILGGQVVLDGDTPYNLKLTVPPQIKLIHTGQKISTAESLATRTPPTALLEGLRNSVMDFLRTQDWLTAMRSHHHLLTAFGVVPEIVSLKRREWMDRGWIRGLKTTGAGGGDALLVWLNPEAAPLLDDELRALGWWRSPYAFAVKEDPNDAGRGQS